MQRVQKARAGLAPALRRLDAEGEQARGAPLHVVLGQRVVFVVGQAGVADPGHLGVFLQVLRHLQGVVADAVHAQRQGFDALQDLPGVERRERGAGVAQRHDPRAGDVGRRAQRLGIDHAVVAHVRLVQALEARLVLGPGELAAVDDGAAQRGAVPAQVLGQRVHHDVGAVLERPDQVGRAHGVVDDQRHAVLVRDGRHAGDVGDVAGRVADGLHVHGLGALVDQLGEAGRVAVVGKAGLDAVLRQRVREQVVGAAVQCRAADDVVAHLGDGLQRVQDGRLAAGHRQRADAAFQRRHALFQHVGGGVRDAGVDVARHLQVEQVGAVLRAVEGVSHGLVDRHRHRLGGRVRRVAGVHGLGFKLPLLGHGRLLETTKLLLIQ